MPGFQLDIMGSGASSLLAANINGVGVSGLTATGSTQATALLITSCSNIINTAAASTGVRLPGATESRAGVGDIIAVYNLGANALAVYPPVGGTINLIAVNTALSVPTGKAALFSPLGNGNYLYFLSA